MHPTTQRLATAYATNPPHALLVTGPHGVGASSLANHIATNISRTVLTVLPQKDDVTDLEKGIIPVGLIRRLYEQTRTTIQSRVVIIDYAERMAANAQNAFLKLLEEPNSGTFFILVSHEPAKLLPTVLSRVQRLDMQPVTANQTKQLLDDLGITDATKHTQLLYMAEGLPAELTHLATNQPYFEQSASMVRDAKILLQGNPYDKLLLAHKYKDNRKNALRLLDITIAMLRQSLSSSVTPATIQRLDQLSQAYDYIVGNGNIRLQLAQAVV